LHIAVDNATVDGTKGVRITNPAGTTVVLECGVSNDSFVGSTSSDFNIRAGNVEVVRITNTGLVGIGTSTPAFLTEIVGGANTVETTLLQIRSNAGGIGTGSTIAFCNSTTAAAGSGRVELAAIRETSSGGSLVIRIGDSGGTIQNRAKINESGQFLLGTTAFTSAPPITAGLSAGNFRSLYATIVVNASSTATILTLSSSAIGTYIIQANFNGQGNEIYGGMLIVVANSGSFRIVTNGSGSSCALSLSGANVQITNAIGSALDATGTAILIANGA
jgi:hypothetical protein